jgi:hypothetical protein
MSTQTVTGFAQTSTGGVPLSASITNGSDSQELTTNATYTVTSQSLGTFKDGATLHSLSVNSATGICYAGVLRNGQFIAVCQSLGSLALGGQPVTLPVLPAAFQLVAGDQIIVRTEA